MFREDVADLLEAGSNALWITTHEEPRVMADLVALAKASNLPAYTWSQIRGVTSVEARRGANPSVPPDQGLLGAFAWSGVQAQTLNSTIILILCDPHESLKDAAAKRGLRELIESRSDVKILILSPMSEVPFELSRLVIPLRFALPIHDEMVDVIKRDVRGAGLTSAQIIELAESAMGLTASEARIAARFALARHGVKKLADVAQEIWITKTRLYNASGLVVVRRPTETLSDIGGCFEFKKWVDQRLRAFTPEARIKGIPTPRGVVFVGPYGVGKSLLSRSICNALGWCYIEWNIGKLLGPYVGTTEQNTDRLLEFTDLHRPCVVRLDEIGHQVSGYQSSAYTDSGVVSRLIGRILTYMEERRDGVFFVASTNEPWNLPPHMVRAGRFDAIFHLELPDSGSMEEIFAIHSRRYCPDLQLDYRSQPVRNLVRKMVEMKFSGAEVEQAIVEAVQVSYPSAPTLESFEECATKIVPIAMTMAEDMERLEKWARGRARPA